jgi:hypothetical protein
VTSRLYIKRVLPGPGHVTCRRAITRPFPLLFPFPFPIPFPSIPHLPCLSPSHRLFPSLTWSFSHLLACPPHSRGCHCHCHCQNSAFHHLTHWHPPSCHHKHPRRVSHTTSVVKQRGSRPVCTAYSLAAQYMPGDQVQCKQQVWVTGPWPWSRMQNRGGSAWDPSIITTCSN